MSKAQRIKEVLFGLIALMSAALMMIDTELGYLLVAFILSIMLVVAGIRRIAYYATMARHMVGGKSVLYLGVLLLDMGIAAGSLATTPQSFIMLYLLGCHLFSGVILVLRAREQRALEAPWRLTLAHGIANILVAGACLIFRGSEQMVVYVYSLGLIYSACLRIVSAFRRTSIVYIP